MNKEKVKKEIDELSLLEYNWDSYGAEQFTKKLLNRAKDISDGLYEKYNDPQVVPCCSPGINFEWNHNGNSLEVEVCDSYIVYLKVIGDDDRDWKEGEINSCEEINEMLEWLYGEK